MFPSESTRECLDEKAPSNSNSTKKPVQGATSKPEYQKNEIPEPSRHDQDLSVPAKEVGNVRRILNFPNGSIQNKCIDMGVRSCPPQVWLTNAKLSERAKKLAAVDTNPDQNFPGRAKKFAAENLEINDEDDSKWPHTLRVSGANVPHLEKVYSNLRRQLKRETEDKMDYLNVNTMIWGTFMLVTQQAAVQLGNDYVKIYIQPKISHKEQ